MTIVSIDHEPMLTVADVAEALNVSPRTLYRMWKRGEGPAYVQAGPRSKRCKVSELHKYIDAQSVEGVA